MCVRGTNFLHFWLMKHFEESVSFFMCRSYQDKGVAAFLARELERYLYTPFSDTVASQALKVQLTWHGPLEIMDTCKLGLILWSKYVLKDLSYDMAWHLYMLAKLNIPVLHLLFELNVSDLKDTDRRNALGLEVQRMCRLYQKNTSMFDSCAKIICKWVEKVDATNAFVYDRMATSLADYARLVAQKAAHIAFSRISSGDGEQLQDRKDVYQDRKDVCKPDLERDYCVYSSECKLVTVSFSSEDSCDEVASMLAAELKEMSYNVLLTDLDCSDAAKDQILLQSSLRLFVLSDSFFRKENCLVDVVKNDHAPMISLFYKISVSEFTNEEQRELWRKEWSRWNNRNDIMASWEKAVKILGSCDHIEYISKTSNIRDYVQAVTEAVSHRVPLQVIWSYESSQVQGKVQMCEKVDALFHSKASVIHGGTKVLGVHGVWGVGKSSLGKALCDFYSPEFLGRVCYVELGSTPLSAGSNGMRLHQQKRILQDLFKADAKFLEWCVGDFGQANAYLDYCLGEASKKVFLVIDNIQDSLQSFEEARGLLARKFPFPRGSKVLLLARSPHTLRRLLQPLESLFDSVVDFPWSILRTFHDRIFRQVVESAGGPNSSGHLVLDTFRNFYPDLCQGHHPLTIKSLALFAWSIDPMIWECVHQTERTFEHLEPQKEGPLAFPVSWKHLGHFVEEGLLNCVFETLQKSYNAFDSKEQQFFLDVALYMPSATIHELQKLHDFVDELFSTTVKHLRKLRDEAFLMSMGRVLRMPAVCRLFAERMVKRYWSSQMMHIARENVKWACMHDNVLKASNLGRIALENCHFVQGNAEYECFILDLSSCKYLSVLRLWGNMSEKRIEIQLGSYTALKCLEVSCNTCPINVAAHCLHITCFKGDYCVSGVASLDFNAILPESLQVLEIFMPTGEIDLCHLTNCINVSALRLHGQVSYDCTRDGYISWVTMWSSFGPSFDANYWIGLREFILEDAEGLLCIRGLDHLCDLRVLHLGGLKHLEFVEGMEQLTKLEEFHLRDCDKIVVIVLPCTSRLRHCYISRCKILDRIDVSKAVSGGKSGDSDEEDEGLEDENRFWLHYDANMWRGWSSGSRLLHPDGQAYGDHQQNHHSFMSGEQNRHKFKVWGCPYVRATNVLALTENYVFEFSCGDGNSVWQLKELNADISAGFILGSTKVTGFAVEKCSPLPMGSTKLTYLEVTNVGTIEWNDLQMADGLKELAIDCRYKGSLLCSSLNWSFFWLPESVRELKVRCRHVRNLSGLSDAVHIISLDLEGCINVVGWPDFSKMPSLCVLNLRNTSWKGPHPFNKSASNLNKCE